jgi:hypothetical protein
MFHESEILVLALLNCRGLGIVALPVHDAVLVPQSQWREAKLMMSGAFYVKTDFNVLVDGPKTADGSKALT